MMRIGKLRYCGLMVGLCGCLAASSAVEGTSFLFGTNGGGLNGVYGGQSTASISVAGTTGTFVAGPPGAILDDSDAQGLGIDSSPIPGIDDVGNSKAKFTIVRDTNSVPTLAGQGESLSFSFDRPGVLESLLFDGVKDETLEYFQLTFPNGEQITIFDSQAEFRLDLQGYHLSDLQVPNPIECQFEDDDLTGINYSYLAGEVFTLTYGEGDYSLVPDYKTDPRFPQFPNARGDGARLQGIVVTSVPEPASCVLLVIASAGWALRRPRGRVVG